MKIPPGSALLTDLYQLTMLQAYYEQDMHETAVFEFFVRKLPRERNFLVAAGLEQALDYLETVHFTPEELDWLKGCGRFSSDFVDHLAGFRFQGEVRAMAEGRVFFADEPILQVIAPLPQAQLVESRLINILHFQTLIASKSVRARLAAPDALLVDFGMRRAHGGEAALMAARANYLAGFDGSATVLAGALYPIPLFGTMAHSFVLAHDDELQAFEHFAQAQPDNVVLPIDSYDTEAAAAKLQHLAPRLARRGIEIKGVRLDSGDLAEHARRVRQILDQAGLVDVTIFASGNLDEYALQRLQASGAPIDGFGLGTRLDTSADAPSLDCAYKLEEYAGRPRRKRSEGKATWPGRKQLWRQYDAAGRLCGDTLALATEEHAGEALLLPVMRNGRRLAAAEPLADIRARLRQELERLPQNLLRLEPQPAYPVAISPALRRLAAELDAATH